MTLIDTCTIMSLGHSPPIVCCKFKNILVYKISCKFCFQTFRKKTIFTTIEERKKAVWF